MWSELVQTHLPNDGSSELLPNNSKEIVKKKQYSQLKRMCQADLGS